MPTCKHGVNYGKDYSNLFSLCDRCWKEHCRENEAQRQSERQDRERREAQRREEERRLAAEEVAREQARAREQEREAAREGHVRNARRWIRLGGLVEARIELEKAVRLKPKDATVHTLLANIATAEGDGNAAMVHHMSAADLDPTRERIRDLLELDLPLTDRIRYLEKLVKLEVVDPTASRVLLVTALLEDARSVTQARDVARRVRQWYGSASGRVIRSFAGSVSISMNTSSVKLDAFVTSVESFALSRDRELEVAARTRHDRIVGEIQEGIEHLSRVSSNVETRDAFRNLHAEIEQLLEWVEQRPWLEDRNAAPEVRRKVREECSRIEKRASDLDRTRLRLDREFDEIRDQLDELDGQPFHAHSWFRWCVSCLFSMSVGALSGVLVSGLGLRLFDGVLLSPRIYSSAAAVCGGFAGYAVAATALLARDLFRFPKRALRRRKIAENLRDAANRLARSSEEVDALMAAESTRSRAPLRDGGAGRFLSAARKILLRGFTIGARAGVPLMICIGAAIVLLYWAFHPVRPGVYIGMVWIELDRPTAWAARQVGGMKLDDGDWTKTERDRRPDRTRHIEFGSFPDGDLARVTITETVAGNATLAQGEFDRTLALWEQGHDTPTTVDQGTCRYTIDYQSMETRLLWTKVTICEESDGLTQTVEYMIH